MTTGLATRIQETERTIAALECSLRVYREHPAAAARVGEQLDAAYLTLSRLEAEMRGTGR